jgi:hypothetical protein
MRNCFSYWSIFAALPALAGLFGCDILRFDRSSEGPKISWTVAPNFAPADGQSHVQVAFILSMPGGVQLMKMAHFSARKPPCSGNVFLGGVPAVQAGVGAAYVQMAAADHNADGTMDLITADSSDNTVSVHFGQGHGIFAPRVAYPVGKMPSAIAVADINGDGRQDLVVANNVDSSISVLLQENQNSFASAVSYPLLAKFSPLNIAVNDFNGDGHPDVVTAN